MITSASAYSRCSCAFGHAVAAAVVVQGVERPASGEAEAAHHRVDERGRLGRAVVVLALHQHRRRAGVGLDVVGLEAEPLEPDEVVHRLPDDAGDRHLGHHAEQDDLRPVATGLDRRVPSARRSRGRPRSRPAARAPARSVASAGRRRPAVGATDLRLYSDGVQPVGASSSSCVPCSTSRPSSSTRIRSACGSSTAGGRS